MLPMLLSILIGVLLLSYLLKKRYAYFSSQGVASLKPVPILGNTYRMILSKDHIAVDIARHYRDLEGHDIGGIFNTIHPMWIPRDPALISSLLVSHFTHFHDRGIPYSREGDPTDDNLIFVEGSRWKYIRQKLSPTFTSGKIKSMFEQMLICGELLLKTMENEVQKNKELDIRDIMARFTTDVIGSCAFGWEPAAIQDPDCKFRRVGRKIFDATFRQKIYNAIRFALPSLYVALNLQFNESEVSDFFVQIVKDAIQHRIDTGERRADFVQLLLQLKTKGKVEYDDPHEAEKEVEDEDDSFRMNDSTLAAQAFAFFAAGFETSATSMSLVLYELSKKQDFQERARQEVKEVKAKYGGKFTYEALKEMKYLEACFKESLRLNPAVGVILRRCTKDFPIPGGHGVIRAGDSVAIPALGLHRDAKFFPNPMQYDPHRFINAPPPQQGTYLPFGDGPRECIGKRFAYVQVKLGLSLLLEKYKFYPSPKLKGPIEYKPSVFVSTPKDSIWLVCEKYQ